MKRFAVTTLGCKVNQFETADMVAQFIADGWQIVPFDSEADIYLINSCTVTGRSDAESRRMIRRARRLNPDAVVVATGCYAQVSFSEVSALPEVDLVFGNEEKHNILQHIANNRHHVTDLSTSKNTCVPRLKDFAEHTRAFLQIQNGCDACCSYCIVPKARGASRSVPHEQVVEAVNRFAGSGYQEVVLTGIHLGAYGLDFVPSAELADLLRLIESECSVRRIRLGSVEPNELGDNLLEIIAKSNKLCPHLHIPLQSGSDTVLCRMERGYTASQYRNRIEKALTLLPDVFIAADLIAGFPGETDEEFEETLHFVEELPLADLHVFPYSLRPGTMAASMKGHIRPVVIKERAEKLRNLASEKRHQFSLGFIGKKLQVLGQRHDPASMLVTGLSRNYLEIQYNAPASSLNQELTVDITEFRNGKLYGIAE